MSMLRAREALMAPFRPVLTAEGLTEPQWRVLRALFDAPELSVAETAEATMLLGPSVSRIIRDLEGRELIERISYGRKPNQYHLRIAPDGKRLVRRLLPKADACLTATAELFGAERMQQLQSLLNDFGSLAARSGSLVNAAK